MRTMRKVLVAGQCCLVMATTLAAQETAVEGFRNGQWGADVFVGNGFGGAGLLRFTSPTRALVFNVSSNLDWRSFLHNHEVTAVVLGADFGRTMRASFERDLAASKPITPDLWRERPVSARVKESFARIWEYWL